MSSDKERIHRWITQAELERMLDDAHQRGSKASLEARVEIEQLKFELGMAIAREHVALSRDEVQLKHSAFQDGYKRGAEAMREAAAQVFDREAAAWGERLGGVIPKAHAYAIRALPLPEDKR